MANPHLELTEEQKNEVLSLVKKDPKEESALTYIKEGRSELEEKILAQISTTMSEAEKDLWFPKEEVKVDLERVTSDLRDIRQWSEILKKYKDGEFTEETMVDFISLSHVAVTEEPDPINVLERQVRDGLKSRTGATLVKRLCGAVNNAWEETVTDLVKLLPEDKQKEFKPVRLLAAAEKEEDNANSLLPVKAEIHDFVKNELALITPDYTEQLVKELFVGEYLYDRLIELEYEELLEKLKDPEDLDFSTIRTIIVDAGYESKTKATTRLNGGEVVSDDPKVFVIYIAWLKNIFEGFKGTNSNERGIDKFRLKGEMTPPQFKHVMSLIQERYYKYMEGRYERSSIDMGWLKSETVNKNSKLPEYNVDPNFTVDFVRSLAASVRGIHEVIPPEGASPATWAEIYKDFGETVYNEIFKIFFKDDKNT